MRPIIDSHLDISWNALGWDRDVTRPLHQINSRESGLKDHYSRSHATTSLPEMRRGGVAVCLATVLVGAEAEASPTEAHSRRSVEYPTQDAAYAVAQGQLAYYRLLEQHAQVKMIGTAAELDAHWNRWLQGDQPDPPVGFILAMEGADPIIDPDQAEAWFGNGLRCVGMVHYGRSRYAVGTGQSGPLTEDGVELLGEFERLGMILDVTHLCEPSFFQALDLFGGPVMASHNNCRSLVPGDRQFSDQQITQLVGREAVIGVCMDAWMLYPDWQLGQTSREVVGLDAVADHVDHICQLAGNSRHVGIGSDLDGGYGSEQAPLGLDTIADLQKLAGILLARGYSEEDVDNVFHGNWLRFFRRHLPR